MKYTCKTHGDWNANKESGCPNCVIHYRKNIQWLERYFRDLRFSEHNHLGMGDIRLTIGQQDDIIKILSLDESNDLTER